MENTANDALIIRDLIVSMQLAFYLHGGDAQFAKATEAMRDVAKNAIVKRRIPNRLYYFAAIFVDQKDIKAFINKTHAIYDAEFPGEADNGTLVMP